MASERRKASGRAGRKARLGQLRHGTPERPADGIPKRRRRLVKWLTWQDKKPRLF